MATHAIDYSPRNQAPALRYIDAAEIRLPTIEEYRARRARLYRGCPSKKAELLPVNECGQRKFPDETGYNVTVEPAANQEIDAVSLYRCVFSTLKELGRRKVSEIIKSIAEAHKITVDEIKGVRRTRHIVAARKEAYYQIAVERPDLSWPQIGGMFGGKDHTTVLHGARVHALANGLPEVTRA